MTRDKMNRSGGVCESFQKDRNRLRRRPRATPKNRKHGKMGILLLLSMGYYHKTIAFVVLSPATNHAFMPTQDTFPNCPTLNDCQNRFQLPKPHSMVLSLASSNPHDNEKTRKSSPPGNNRGNKKGPKKGNSNNQRQKKMTDPSKQKKREIMDEIKAKIQQEERRTKDQPKKHTRMKSNDKTPSKSAPNKTRPSKTKKPLQVRQQTLDDDDLLEPEETALGPESVSGRKRLFMNPFEAGKSFRDTLSSLSTLTRGLPKETKEKYFLDDRLLDADDEVPGLSSSSLQMSTSPLFETKANRLLKDYAADAEATTYIPEVLVVGATGEIGRLVVRRLLLEGKGRFRVRVLVRDLYSQTLNLLGTGVSYCQGDLSNVESLEYALTDVDKIVYVAGAPKPDEDNFQKKFRWYLQEQNIHIPNEDESSSVSSNQPINDREWEQLSSILEVRSELAEQIDCIGMKNLVSAYQNVRHTDYGTSQAAKRSLFKFSEKSNDFDLFDLDDGDDEELTTDMHYENNYNDYAEDTFDDDDENDDEYDYDDYDDDSYGLTLESRNAKDTNVVKSQVRWLQNKFFNGVFVGKVPKAVAGSASSQTFGGGEAAIITNRLRARENPNQGIDMSNFSGLILRLVSDGGNYEAFIRTNLYEKDGVEYVYEFGTDSKQPTPDNKSKSRFKTVRLAFENFRPVQRLNKRGNDLSENESGWTVPPFDGSDVRHLGFRFRSSSNLEKNINKFQANLEQLSRGGSSKARRNDDFQRFYMALSYIKVYRAQPEPEFIYLSDARIPPVITDGMISHDRKMLLTSSADANLDPIHAESGKTLLDDKDLQRRLKLERSPEETYFKYRGEDILIKSGLSYTILRVAGFNELSTSEASTIDLVSTPSNSDNIVPVSRAEVAQVCVSALLDPAALNKIVYMTKKKVVGKNVLDEEDISAKFEGIPTDIIL